jgi:hypothetical protein
VQTADPKLALDVWRRRPVRVEGELPLFVLQALAETGEWEDPAHEGSLQNLGRLGRDEPSQARLFALTKLELLRGKRLSDVHLDLLRQVDGGAKPEYLSLTSVAEATMHCEIVPPSVLESGQFASETRLYLVHATQFSSVSSFRPHLDTLVVMQKDWADQVKDVYLSPLEWLVEGVREFVQSLFSPSPARSGDDVRWSSNDAIRRFAVLADAQTRLTALDGGPLDYVSQLWRELRRRVTVDVAGRTAEAKVLVLRGTTQEFYRPIRQALCEALTTEQQVAGFITRLRPAFSICPVDLEPSEFVPRALRDPTNWFLSLVQCADRARIIETLLDAALKEVPDHPKLRRVRESWVAWDRALGKGHSSDWILSRRR